MQVSFPGGKFDPSDRDEVHTALRETHEEVGLPPEQVTVLGMLPDAIARNGGNGRETVVTPIVGYVGSLQQLSLTPNLSEVAYCFTVPVSRLRDTQHRDLFKGTPRFLMDKADDHIWGFTGYVLSRFLKSVEDFSGPLKEERR